MPAEPDELKNREILLAIGGGVAAYKIAELASLLVKQQACVSVAMTESAGQFIGATTFEALTNRPVHRALFDPREHYLGEHIGLARRAELLLIAPATANLLARLAHGFADDLVSTLALAATCPRLIAPAMNVEMWSKPAVQRNVKQLMNDGYELIEPDSGWLSCGQVGAGRMAEPAVLLQRITTRLNSESNAG